MTKGPVGSENNPMVVRHKGDLDRLAARIDYPTPKQRDADNFREGHAIVGGLNVSIEIPRGKIKIGAADSGDPWAAVLTAHYGYVKGTEDRDGEQVDAYFGPDAYQADKYFVWVVDKLDKKSGEFDEHKCMVGFGSEEDARRTFVESFGDGLGEERIGAITRMNFIRFADWLAHGDTKDPVSDRVAKAHVGHRHNPAVVEQPGDLDRAVLRVWRPTEGQARAGNYQKAHAIVGGCLYVTVETPKDGIRSGTGPDGTVWSVTMPCHYGYVKRTTGADGDAVDAYFGPDAHNAATLPVWVIDQRDADSRAFDEHKCMLGFTDRAAVRDAYERAFSDGRARDRVGAVVRMPFDAFVAWLRGGDTASPLAMEKSASHASTSTEYGPATCQCGCTGTGGHMADPTTTGLDAGKLSILTAKGFAAMTPKERAELLAGVAIDVDAAIAKASDIMTEPGHAHDRVHTVEDLWDGPADAHLKTVPAAGPDSSAAPGMTNVGPTQSASGDGAARMERTYSRPAPQTGVQAATEELGRRVGAQASAMKSLVRAMRLQGTVIEGMKASLLATPVEVPDSVAIAKAMVEAIAKAVRQRPPVALAKAEHEEKDDKDEKKEEKKDENPFAKAEHEAKDGKADEEDEKEDMDEAVKAEVGVSAEFMKSNVFAAARLIQMAKSRATFAKSRASRAEELFSAGRIVKAVRRQRMVKADVRIGNAYLAAAKSLLGDVQFGPIAVKVGKTLAKAETKWACNQDKWPNKGPTTGTGKSETAVAAVTTVTPATAKSDVTADINPAIAALRDASEQVSKALSGVGMFQTNVEGLINRISGMPASGAPANPMTGVVPVLAKANVDDLTVVENKVTALYQDGSIGDADMDRARDVIGMARAKVPEGVLAQKMAMLPEEVRGVFNGARLVA